MGPLALGVCLSRVREKKPLIHNITNYVTANDVANMVLACGASPIMSDEPQEAAEITAACAGLNLNIGTPNDRRIRSMFLAGRRANELGHAVLLDPVGAGASAFRRRLIRELFSELRFTAVRGNFSELRAVADECAPTFLPSCGTGGERGVDAAFGDTVTETGLEASVRFVKEAACSLGCVVAVSGDRDLVSDGKVCAVIENGRPEMRDITGTGCQLSGLMTAFLAASPERPFEAAVAAVCAMGEAGETGWRNLNPSEGSATYRNRIIDAVYRMDAETLEREARYELR